MRKKMSRKASRRNFTRHAGNVQSINTARPPMRGGYRI